MKKLVNYQLNQCKKAIIIYYIVILSILVITNVLAVITNGQTGVAVSNSTIVMSFVLGIVLFKSFFNFFQQNGVSRNSQIKSYAIFTLVLALILSVFDTILLQTSLLFGGGMGSNIMEMYDAFVSGTSYLSKTLFVLVWQFVHYSIMLSIGHFIALLYYRMSKLYRIIVSVTVPIVFLTVVSYAGKIGVLGKSLSNMIEFMYGRFYLINGVLPMVGLFFIIFFINKMLIKGAQVR